MEDEAEPYCVIIYGHKYGTDSWLARFEDAERSIVNTILSNMGDCCDASEQREVLKLVAAGKLGEAIEAYSEASAEWFDTVRQGEPTVEPDPTANAVARLAVIEVYSEASLAALDAENDSDDPTCNECEAQGATQYLPCPIHPEEAS